MIALICDRLSYATHHKFCYSSHKQINWRLITC